MNKKQMKKAVALKYNLEKDNAPKVVAAGQGIVAENIIDKAEEMEVPIHKNEKLVKELIQLRVGTEIPPQLYEIVAQVLVFIEGVDERIGNRE